MIFNLGGRKQALSPYEAAQAVFPSLSRPLQKYLRVTRQQPRHTMESILHHLSTCLSFDMSPRSFLEKYLVSAPVLQVSFMQIVFFWFKDFKETKVFFQTFYARFRNIEWSRCNFYYFCLIYPVSYNLIFYIFGIETIKFPTAIKLEGGGWHGH